jgi:CheY-like chemotaxis protein
VFLLKSAKVQPIGMPINAASFPQRRILVVDDEPEVCHAVKLLLNFDGHIVEIASNGQDALAMLDAGKFDVVITDFEMPKMRGDELAAAIKARSPEQPIVMITAYAEMIHSAGLPLKGVDFLISKPFLLENLRQAIAKAAPAKPQQTGKEDK